MKKFYLLFTLLICLYNLFGQVPDGFKYQAVLRDAAGNVKANANVGIDIAILQGSVLGTQVFLETHNVSTNEFGLVTLAIGSKNTSEFSSIDWSSGPFYIKVSVDGAEMGTSQLLSVPYALHAKTADNGFSGDYNDLANKPNFTNWDDNKTDDFSGSYTDLTNKPIIPTINDASTSPTSLWSSSKTNTELGNKANTVDIYTKTNLHTSGQAVVHYNNISNKPTNIDEDKTDDVSLATNQTITGSKSFTGTVGVISPVNGTDAVNKAYADEIKKQIFTQIAGISIKDLNGGDNSYYTVKIGNQVWMAENLRTSYFNDGTPIPLVTDPVLWSSLTTPAYCWYDNNEASNKKTYGALYNLYAINTGKLCHTGWHVPASAEWSTLIIAASAYIRPSFSGWALRESGTEHWNYPNEGTNDSGFTALPGGWRKTDGTFNGIRTIGYWWSTGYDSPTDRYKAFMTDYRDIDTELILISKEVGLSVRCVKD